MELLPPPSERETEVIKTLISDAEKETQERLSKINLVSITI